MRKLNAADDAFPSFVTDLLGIGNLNMVTMDPRLRTLERQYNTLQTSFP